MWFAIVALVAMLAIAISLRRYANRRAKDRETTAIMNDEFNRELARRKELQ